MMASVSVLSACAGYNFEGHHNIPDRPFILFSVKDMKTLENLWKNVFKHLSVPTYLMYNGANQFLFEIDLPQNWPNRDEMLITVWGAIDSRMKEYK